MAEGEAASPGESLGIFPVLYRPHGLPADVEDVGHVCLADAHFPHASETKESGTRIS